MQHETEILRFTTAGSVDDGKSTLIGRLLYDSKSIFEDQWEEMERSADLAGGTEVNLANLTDGLRAEREQGITIDVAYRYFATPRRKFIIADTPGHVQYTRNMVTGASTANLALILIDARNGVVEQSRRHAYLSALLGIAHMVVCINKMDLVDFSEARYNEIRDQFMEFAPRLDVKDITFIPISALQGDNVVDASENTPWYHGPTLLGHLEEVYIASDRSMKTFRFPVQWVIRPLTGEHHDYRGYAGQIAGGIVKPGDKIIVLPSGMRTTVQSINTLAGDLDEAFCPQSVCILLADDVDISRGDLICGIDNLPHIAKDHEANICWMHQSPMQLGRKYLIKQASNTSQMMVKKVIHQVDIDDLAFDTEVTGLKLNDIGRIAFKTSSPLAYDEYRKNRQTGGFIIIDPATNATVAAGMMRPPPRELPVPDFVDYAI
jgi:bifunctional enzyme CysN/CysC/sulfate adenylyltransferase subunit 1